MPVDLGDLRSLLGDWRSGWRRWRIGGFERKSREGHTKEYKKRDYAASQL